MKIKSVSIFAILMASTCFPVAAADQVAEAPASEEVWSGIYVGIGIGAGAVIHDVGVDLGLLGSGGFNGIGGEGLFGEATVGYDFVTGGGFLFGIGANARYSTIATTLDLPSLGGFGADITADYGFDVFARAGVLIEPRTLAYALAGYSWQHFDVGVSGAGSIYDWGASGFTVGAGFETALSQRFHVKAEYRFSQYQSEDFGSGGILAVTPSFHTATLGLVYRLGAPQQVASFASPDPVSFTGFYVGGAASATGLSHGIGVDVVPDSFNGIGAEGIGGELQVGYDHEFSNGIVAGVQADIGLGTLATTLDVNAPTVPLFVDGAIDQEYQWSVIGRLGYKVTPRTMIFALGGYTQQHYDVNGTISDGVDTVSGSLLDFDTSGFVVGGGIETAVTDKLFVGLEYRYAQTLETFDIGIAEVELSPSSHSGLLTVKYKF